MFFRANIILFSIVGLMPFQAEAGSLKNAMQISAYGIKAQSQRMEVVAENIANSDTTGTTPGGDPYRRKLVYFENQKEPELGGLNVLRVKKVGYDYSEFKKVYRPEHPAADAEGYIKIPNVETSLESMDMREAQRVYEANISVIETTKKMMDRTLDLMR